MKIKLDENLPARLVDILSAAGHDVDTVLDEGLQGCDDDQIWSAACQEGRFLITQDLDFSDTRVFTPGAHPGILLLRLRTPGVLTITKHVQMVSGNMAEWRGCFVVLTENKLRIKRP